MQRLFTLFAVALTACGAALAQPQTSDSPPMIAGRLSLADGDAQIWRVEEDADGADGQWDQAQVNDVVTVATGLYTGPNGRTELRVGPNTLRLASNSRGGFSQLDYEAAVFNLEHGSLNVRLARAEHGEATAVTVGGTRIDLAAPGRYRIDAGDGSGQARITVFNGYASVQTGATPIDVATGQALVVGAGLTAVNFDQAATTAFDQWALARDDRYDNVQSARYVSPYMTGYEELDYHGDWIPDATYGNVWVPRVVPVGWAPYRHGQWRWVRPWGWSWVDHAPWGYAPFHYGRWVTINDRWCWWPGGYHRRPVWAPALVGFVGSGVSVSIGFGSGHVGWYPLAPWHRYRPHYPHNRHYTTIINQTIIHQPPRHGFSRTPPNTHEGTTLVPGPRFRDPVMKVALPPRSQIAELQPIAAPPKNIGQVRRITDDGMVRGPSRVQGAPKLPATQPPSAGTPMPTPSMVTAPKREVPIPTRVMPPIVAQPIPNRGVAPQPPLPGNNPTPLAPPPKFNRVPPTAIQNTPLPPRAADMVRPQPRARMPQELLPQAQQQPRIAPAEPARVPPGAPPTIRQPQPQIKAPIAQPAPAAPPMVQRVAPSPAPRAEAPRAKQPMMRGAPQSMAR
ncbi:MAG: DUF6600 domain-containing protein [Burkholderiaceae bacterium]